MQWPRLAIMVLLVLAGYAIASPLEGPVDRTHERAIYPTDYESDPFSSATALADDPDGAWWVLEHTIDGRREGGVYGYASDWTPTGERHGINLLGVHHNQSVRPMDLHARPGGGWYVLGENSVVYGFDEDWNATGQRIILPRRPGWHNRTAHSIDRAADGGWWTDAYGRLTLYNEQFTTVQASYDGYQDLMLGRAYYNTHYGYMTVGDVTTILADGDSLVLQTSLSEKFYQFDSVGPDGLASTDPDEVVRPDSAPPYVADIEPGPHDRRYILRRDGTLYEYTADWLSVGHTRVVGSGETVDRYPSDVITFAPLVGALVDAAGRLLTAGFLLVALGILRWRDRESRAAYQAATVSGVLAYAFFIGQRPLRPLLVDHRYLLVGGLAVIVGGIAWHVFTEREQALPLLVVYAPVVYSASAIVARLAF